MKLLKKVAISLCVFLMIIYIQPSIKTAQAYDEHWVGVWSMSTIEFNLKRYLI